MLKVIEIIKAGIPLLIETTPYNSITFFLTFLENQIMPL